jgi:hypothetical protein
MVRNRKHQKVDMAKMYRHFAVVTVAATALIGVLADGEAQQAVEDEIKERAEQKRVQEADKVGGGSRELIRRDPYAGGGGGSFSPDSSLTGISAARGSSDSSNFIQVLPGETDNQTVWGRLGISKEDWFSLPPEVRKSLAGTNDPMIVGTAEERRAAMKKASEASRSRARPDTSMAGNAIVLDESTDF